MARAGLCTRESTLQQSCWCHVGTMCCWAVSPDGLLAATHAWQVISHVTTDQQVAAPTCGFPCLAQLIARSIQLMGNKKHVMRSMTMGIQQRGNVFKDATTF